MSKTKFKTGDRVEFVENAFPARIGDLGVVTSVSDPLNPSNGQLVQVHMENGGNGGFYSSRLKLLPKFKVGDKVLQTCTSMGMANAGRVGTVETYDACDNTYYVRFVTGIYWVEAKHLEQALSASAPAPAPAPYEFKVGDKGKTRDGSDYEVLAVCEGAEFPLVVRVSDIVCKDITAESYSAAGQFLKGHRESRLDLMKPVKTITKYANVYQNGSVVLHNTEAQARDGAGFRAQLTAHPIIFVLP